MINENELKKRMGVFLTAVLLFVLSLLFGFQGLMESFAGEERVFDEAALFSQTEREVLEAELSDLNKETGMDGGILTTDNAYGKSSRSVAEDFYIEKGLGVGEDYSGVLFLIDMDNREIYITPVGQMTRYLTDERFNEILDDAYKKISRQEYASCAQSFIDGVRKYYRAGIPKGQYNYDEVTGETDPYEPMAKPHKSLQWYEVFIALGIAFGAAFSACLTVTSQYSMKRQMRSADQSLMAYRADCSFCYSDKADRLVNTSVTHVLIPRNRTNGNRGSGPMGGKGPGSTTHHSSGRSFGGGGRKF